MIDSHAHIINEFYLDIDNLINKLKNKNVIKVINCATSFNDIDEIINLSKQYRGFLYSAIGIHPENIDDLKKINNLEKYIKSEKILAIGEIGLDYYQNKNNKDLQKKLFNYQLDLAEKYKLPVIIHTRDSIQDCYDILKKRKLKGIIHCFSGSFEMANEFIKLGYKLGIGGVVTFKNSKLGETILKLGMENLVLETDSPFLSPEPLRGKKNDSSNLFYIADKISKILNISIDEVINKSNKNIMSIFDF